LQRISACRSIMVRLEVTEWAALRVASAPNSSLYLGRDRELASTPKTSTTLTSTSGCRMRRCSRGFAAAGSVVGRSSRSRPVKWTDGDAGSGGAALFQAFGDLGVAAAGGPGEGGGPGGGRRGGWAGRRG
jgi:hypothetical protein